MQGEFGLTAFYNGQMLAKCAFSDDIISTTQPAHCHITFRSLRHFTDSCRSATTYSRLKKKPHLLGSRPFYVK